MKAWSKFISKSFLVLGTLLSGTSFGESLWTKSAHTEVSMFADKRAGNIGDLLTILVDESITMSTSQKTTTDKSASIVNELSNLLFEGTRLGGTYQTQLPKTDIAGTNAYEGGGTIANTQSISARLSVLVIDKLPNGNLILEGVRAIAYSGETFYLVTRGVCRATDITPSNTIRSSQIAEAKIEVISEGTLTDAQKKGWLMRLNDRLNPF